ncbi:MAG TPA: PH domain-containing protein [Candidatus Limnocylindria bacterium]
MANAPRDVILEPNEQILIATRPLFLWEPLVILEVVLLIAALYLYGQSGMGDPARDNRSPQLEILAGVALFLAVVLFLWMLARWIPWSRKWYVLTDRRVIARWGVFDRNQAALMLARVQDVSLEKPFPKSLLRDFGVVHIESAGEHAEEVISGGLNELDMTEATKFYRALTDAQSKT